MAGYGLVQLGESTKRQGMTGLQHASNQEQQRESMNDQLDAADKQAKVSGTVTGATSGALIGAETGFSAGGYWGAAIGAIAGYLMTEIS